MSVSRDLEAIARTLAAWSDGKGFMIYVFGSRVRGDHRPDSDVDILAIWDDDISGVDHDWWGIENQDEFKSISRLLPGKLHVQYKDDPVQPDVLKSAETPLHQDRNVICVWSPPKLVTCA